MTRPAHGLQLYCKVTLYSVDNQRLYRKKTSVHLLEGYCLISVTKCQDPSTRLSSSVKLVFTRIKDQRHSTCYRYDR